MATIRIGIAGLGDIAQKAYLPVLSGMESVEIVGLLSRTEATVQSIGERYRIAGRYTEMDALLRQEPDAVFLHSPTETHYTLAMELLKRGVHVYVDKPLSYDIREAEAMAEAAERYGRLLAVGFNRRFAPLYREAKAWLAETGGFDAAVAQKHRTRQQKLSAKHTLYDDLIHMLDLLVWLGGDDFTVEQYLGRSSGDGRLLHASGSLAWNTPASAGPEMIGSAAAAVESRERGSQASSARSAAGTPAPVAASDPTARSPHAAAFFSMNRNAGVDLEKLELHGGGRSVEVSNLEHAVFSDREVGERRRTFGSWDPIGVRRGFSGAVRHFLESLESPETCSIRADQVLPSHRLVEKLALWYT